MLPKRAAIQHCWPASSSAHIAGRRCRPFCMQIDINWPMVVFGKRCRPSTTVTSAANIYGRVTVRDKVRLCTWQNEWIKLWLSTQMSCSVRLRESRMTKVLSRECTSRMLNITDENRGKAHSHRKC